MEQNYEKQYQEDLERAQALSLESLALEQFKNKRLLELQSKNGTEKHGEQTTLRLSSSSNTSTTKVIRASSLSESDTVDNERGYNRQLMRPRPSVGSATSAEGTSSLIIPPPKSSLSSTAGKYADTSPDLISFASPPPLANNEPTKHQQQLQATLMWQSSIDTAYSFNSIVQQTPLPQQRFFFQYPSTSYTSPIPPTAITHSSSTTMANALFHPPTPHANIVSNNNSTASLTNERSQSVVLQQAGTAPILPPKNQTPKPPPIRLPSRNSCHSKHSSSSSQKGQHTSESKWKQNTTGENLIDLGAWSPSSSSTDEKNSVRVSILQEFDPILSDSSSVYNHTLRTISPECPDDASSVCESVYDCYDPYDIYTGGSHYSAGSNSVSEPIYASVIVKGNQLEQAPPLPPRSHTQQQSSSRMTTIDRRKKTAIKNKWSLLDSIQRRRPLVNDPDLNAFYHMVYNVRNKYRYNDPNTNMGLIISPMADYYYSEGLSIKLCVHPDIAGVDFHKPINFTCDVTTSVEHVTLQLVEILESNSSRFSVSSNDKYTLKVWGYNEYLVPTTFLSDYEYVHNCIKLDEDVVLILIPDSKVDKSFARTLQDDNRDKDLTFDNIISSDLVTQTISFENLKILLETVENEMKRLVEAAEELEKTSMGRMLPSFQESKVVQAVKCVINLMGCICTLDIMEAVNALKEACQNVHIMDFSSVVAANCTKIRLALQNLIEMYCKAFTVDFEVNLLDSTSITEVTDIKSIAEIVDSLIIRICGIYRPPNNWKYDLYQLSVQLFHGTRPLSKQFVTEPKTKMDQDNWPVRIIYDQWIDFELQLNSLTRESRLVIVVIGLTKEMTQESGGNSGNNNTSASMEEYNEESTSYKQEEIGWSAVQFFNYNGDLMQGSMLMSVWPKESSHEHLYGPAPPPDCHPLIDHSMIGIEIVAPENVRFQKMSVRNDSNKNAFNDLTVNTKSDFKNLDGQTQQQLIEICEQDMLYKMPPDIREVLWEKRHYMHKFPKALPKVLLSAHSWSYANLPDLYGMLRNWSPLPPIEALQLLLPLYPDMQVRERALIWISSMSMDELVDFLPQLVVALRHETYETSALAQFLLDRSLRSPRFAHYLFWLLNQNLPGSLPQNHASEINQKEEVRVGDVRHYRRLRLMLRALLAICGESLRMCFISQQILVKDLNATAEEIQKTKENHRNIVLQCYMKQINANLMDNPTSLPLSPTLSVTGIQVDTCSYFPSNTLPLKINFLMKDSSVIPAIYKVGDDLQQDMLTLQMVRLMDKLWLHQKLDMKMVAFRCVPTGRKRGMIEMVTRAETLRKIQVEHGLTGSFKDKPIAEWLAKHNPTELEYDRAVQNFTASCAGYCVVTYILGICDRHNDNIMLKTSGHLFHIDFGKFLGDAQMFGNFKRDRAPFVLTSDMAYVINGGDRPTEKFHKFVDLCCQAFNIIRANRNLFLYIFTLMVSSGNLNVAPDAVSYLHRALLPGFSNPEAAAHFARLIESSLKSWFTQFNFFLHNLAQLKFSNDNNGGTLLSFVPKVYSKESDGRLTEVKVIGYQKRYDPDKYYAYILRIQREGQKDPMDILRTYKEFCELHQKLCIYFPLAKLYSLSGGLHMGRSNIKQVAQRRLNDIHLFITSLFRCAPEICHSDLVYTFFHPLLRDQQNPEDFSKKNRGHEQKESIGRLKGQLKLSIQYNKSGVFGVMVHHVRGLPKLPNGQEPSTYVKVYLQPDDSKSTKRKTKVVKRNCHPSFMEMLEYRMAHSIVAGRRLRATVWNYDPLQENEFMGGVELDLSTFDLFTETSEWYPLTNLSR